jgi:dienelactone hydrolase
MHANRAGLPGDPHAVASFFRWSAFVGDTAAAIALLRARPEIEAERVGFLGHSEGGLIALAAMVARQTQAN